jgi:hypothetical protein
VNADNTFITSLKSLISGAPSLVQHGAKLKTNKILAQCNMFNGDIFLANDKLAGKNVIITVHGRNGWYTDFELLLQTIIENNFATYNEEFGYLKLNHVNYYLRSIILDKNSHTSLDDDVATLTEQIKDYTDCNIILIGHSKGGLVASRYVALIDDSRIKKVITISSPLKGTKVLDLTFNLLGSTVYDTYSFNNKTAVETGNLLCDKIVDFYHVVPSFDHLIVPSVASQYKNTPQDNIYNYHCSDYSHAGILASPDVVKQVLEWVKQ